MEDTIDISQANAVVSRATTVGKSLNRGQIGALLKVHRSRSQKELTPLDAIYKRAEDAAPLLFYGLDRMQEEEHKADMSRFSSFDKVEGDEFQRALDAAFPHKNGMPRVAVPGTIGLLIPVAVTFTTLFQLTSLWTLLASLGVGALLVGISLGWMAIRGPRPDWHFSDPESASYNYWLIIEDAALAAAFGSLPGLEQEEIDLLSATWREAGLPLSMLEPPRAHESAEAA